MALCGLPFSLGGGGFSRHVQAQIKWALAPEASRALQRWKPPHSCGGRSASALRTSPPIAASFRTERADFFFPFHSCRPVVAIVKETMSAPVLTEHAGATGPRPKP